MKNKGFTPLETLTNRKIRFLTGFTLTEVLIAMLLLSLASAGMFAVFIAGRRFTGGGGRRFEALNFARQTAEHLRDDVGLLGVRDWYATDNLSIFLSTSSIPGQPLAHPHDLPSGDFRDRWSGRRTYDVSWGPADYGNPQRYKIVTVTVSWNEP